MTTAAATMDAELAKLNASQRTAMRRIVCSTLQSVEVERSGWKTIVACESCGFKYLVSLGPRGAILDKRVWEKRGGE